MRAGMPAFVIKATQQQRQLRAEIDDLIARQDITQSVQRANQSGIGLAAIVPAKALHQIIYPILCFGGRAVELLYVSHLQGPAPDCDAASLSFVTKGLDGVERGGGTRRIIAEKHPNGGCERETADDGGERDRRRPPEQL